MISVVIASYKYGHLAAHCIESVLSQSKMPNTIFFVDDGAMDCGQNLGQVFKKIKIVRAD
jgi:glycosyltransferase involved in cell wall biosynthesis